MRRLDRTLALLIGLAAAAVAVLAGIEIVELADGRAPLLIPRHAWDHDLRRQHWGSSDIAITSGILIGVGAVLFLLQLVRRRPVRLALRAYPGERSFVSRKGLARRLAFDVTELDEVTAAKKLKVGRRRIRAKLALAPNVDAAVGRDEARQAITATLAQLAVVRDLKVKIKAKAKIPPAEKSRKGRRVPKQPADAGSQPS